MSFWFVGVVEVGIVVGSEFRFEVFGHKSQREKVLRARAYAGADPAVRTGPNSPANPPDPLPRSLGGRALTQKRPPKRFPGWALRA